ncbi:hypothetical protein ALI144C_07240 [Actinosynnema sp. ALI-1.44]|nr:hypothetical protein ALI144C_07240 [Actinosynnema sp. ALI-1.44]
MDDDHAAIQRWAEALGSIIAATGRSNRQAARDLGFSKSVVNRYINGERVTEDAWVLATKAIDLAQKEGREVPVDLQELESTYKKAEAAHRRRLRTNGKPPTGEGDTSEQAAPDVRPSDDEPLGDPPPRQTSFRRHRVAYSIGAGILALGLVYGVVSHAADWWPFEPRVWYAKVVGTYSAEHKRPLGVFRFRSPDIPKDTDRVFYDEGSAVPIVCQDRRRREVTDPTTKQSSTVWNRTSDGWWIPDLYTDLPKVPGDTPPLSIPTC